MSPSFVAWTPEIVTERELKKNLPRFFFEPRAFYSESSELRSLLTIASESRANILRDHQLKQCFVQGVSRVAGDLKGIDLPGPSQ